MYLKKCDLNIAVQKDVDDKAIGDLSVVAVIHQQMLWENLTECCVVYSDGRRYSAVFDGDIKLTDFTEVKKQEAK